MPPFPRCTSVRRTCRRPAVRRHCYCLRDSPFPSSLPPAPGFPGTPSSSSRATKSRCGRTRIASLHVLEHMIHADAEGARDAECQQQGREVFSRFQRHDGVPCYARLFRQIVLRHLPMIEAQAPNVVPDLGFFARHDYPLRYSTSVVTDSTASTSRTAHHMVEISIHTGRESVASGPLPNTSPSTTPWTPRTKARKLASEALLAISFSRSSN